MCIRDRHVFYTVLHVAAKSSIISPKDRALSICERFRISIKNNLKNTCSIYIDQPRWLEELPASYIEITEEQEANHHLYYDTVSYTHLMRTTARRNRPI